MCIFLNISIFHSFCYSIVWQVASFLCDGIVESLQTRMDITTPGRSVCLSVCLSVTLCIVVSIGLTDKWSEMCS